MHEGNNSIGPLPDEVESLVSELVGSNWRSLPKNEVDGALGIAIVYLVLQGCSPNAVTLATKLGIDKWWISRPLKALSLNGVFQRHRLEGDRAKLEAKDALTWLYYAGYASESTGIVEVNRD